MTSQPSHTYYAPAGLGEPAPVAPFYIGGTRPGFTGLSKIDVSDTGIHQTICDLSQPDPTREKWLKAYAYPRPQFAGFQADKTIIMGIVNVTPDSFSDGGDHATTEAAVAHALSLAEQGADILDVGGESTRPGADPVAPDVEAARVIPVITALAEKGLTVSVDTRRASVMEAAVEAGTKIINDVTALTGDPHALDVAAKSNTPVILMHMQGEPQTMQSNPTYRWAPGDVLDVLRSHVNRCLSAGLDLSQICVDPGIGFGKKLDHNLDLLRHLGLFHALGCWVALGASRKSFIGKLSSAESPKDRMPGSIAVATTAMRAGIQILRVHDVAETAQARAVVEAI